MELNEIYFFHFKIYRILFHFIFKFDKFENEVKQFGTINLLVLFFSRFEEEPLNFNSKDKVKKSSLCFLFSKENY